MADLDIRDLGRDAKWRTFEEPASGLYWSVTPGEWTVLSARPQGEVVDLTSVRAMFRLTGDRAPDVMAKICALNLSDATFPNGSSARTLVAGVATELVRDDQEGTRSYLILPSRSFGRYMAETIRDAGAEFGLSS